MLNLTTRYIDLGQRALADTMRFQTICFTCAARLTNIQAGAAGAWLAPLRDEGAPGDARTREFLKYLDETNQALIDAQSQLRSVIDDRWAEVKNELALAAQEFGADGLDLSPSTERPQRKRSSAVPADDR
jgi:hypothetical protein